MMMGWSWTFQFQVSLCQQKYNKQQQRNVSVTVTSCFVRNKARKKIWYEMKWCYDMIGRSPRVLYGMVEGFCIMMRKRIKMQMLLNLIWYACALFIWWSDIDMIKERFLMRHVYLQDSTLDSIISSWWINWWIMDFFPPSF